MIKKEIIIPFSFKINVDNKNIPSSTNHIIRRLSSMKGMYKDEKEYRERLKREDELIYEVYEVLLPEKQGELNQGMSVVHPGKVGDEYFMTKGHFHSILETAELYYCLKGEGYMIMETKEGEWHAEKLSTGIAVYVPGGWAHRSVNISDVDLVTLFIYPADAGHDYAVIEEKGFRKIVVEENGNPVIQDNPKWN